MIMLLLFNTEEEHKPPYDRKETLYQIYFQRAAKGIFVG